MSLGGGKRKTDPGYGRGVVELSIGDEAFLDEESVTQRLLEVFSSPDYQPPTLPSVAIELLALAQNPSAGIDDVVTLLERDTMLTGRILRIAHSPVYAGAVHLTSVKDAVMRLGLTTVRDIVLEASMKMRVFRADSFTGTMERLRAHSTFTGHLARLICRYTSIEKEYAFLCGLLHDVGVAGTLIVLCDGIPKDKRPDLIAIWPAIDRVHAEAGQHIARLWELPADVQVALSHHHQVLIDRHPHPLAATVCLADAIANEMGLGLIAQAGQRIEGANELETACLQSHTTIDQSTQKTLEHARRALDLNDAQLGLIRSEAEELREQLP